MRAADDQDRSFLGTPASVYPQPIDGATLMGDRDRKAPTEPLPIGFECCQSIHHRRISTVRKPFHLSLLTRCNHALAFLVSSCLGIGAIRRRSVTRTGRPFPTMSATVRTSTSASISTTFPRRLRTAPPQSNAMPRYGNSSLV